MKVVSAERFNNEALLDYDPIGGVKTYFSSGGKGDQFWSIRQEFESVAPELEASKSLQKDDDHWKNGVKNSWLHAAHIPDSILLKWHAMGVNINNPKELLKMVQKPEWRYLMCVDKVLV
jgi:hypothetical protein